MSRSVPSARAIYISLATILALSLLLLLSSFPKQIKEKQTVTANESSSTAAAPKYNRLIHVKRPYLLQHAANPVDWYPWGEEAFEKARKENKPIYLSIGYSTCHWCHVMERESYEDSQVAKLLNEAFVNIKVDREERPDIDNIYMNVAVMLNGSGGWPLNIVMTPDKKPFFAATYIPKESRFGRAGMMELIPRIKDLWQTRHEDILKSANQITTAITENASSSGNDLGVSTLKSAYQAFVQSFDTTNGGFGEAPKFPSPHQFLFLLRYWKRTGDAKALQMVEQTLIAMRLGGIYDHVGFGFHRYSTDAQWLLPHFEKMIYDQALLAIAYTDAYQATGNPEYKSMADEILTYVLRDMTSPLGGFYSAEDADSEGQEGKFYLWNEQEIRKILGETEAIWVIQNFSIEKDSNFIDSVSGVKGKGNILHLSKPLDLQYAKRWEAARQKLFAAREKRIHPSKDDKILTDWNGLMIAAFAKAGQVFGNDRYNHAAERAAGFLLKNMRMPDAGLLHRYRDSQAAIQANLDDYTFLTWGLLELYESTFKIEYLKAAISLNEYALKHFWDETGGAFYLTPDNGEVLLTRSKEFYDGAIPSGNSVAMLNLLRLARMTADADLEQKAARLERAFSATVERAPMGFSELLSALDFALGPSYEVVIAGDPASQDTKQMLEVLHRTFVPNKIVLLLPSNENTPEITRLAEFTKFQRSIGGKATAYVCLNFVCNLPTTDSKKMLDLLSASDRRL
jgi:uncharacterized protein YyaL (SSP411 family)